MFISTSHLCPISRAAEMVRCPLGVFAPALIASASPYHNLQAVNSSPRQIKAGARSVRVIDYSSTRAYIAAAILAKRH